MKIAHPEPAFREAAEEACRSIGTMVEKYVLFSSVKYWVTWFRGFVLQGAGLHPAGCGMACVPATQLPWWCGRRGTLAGHCVHLPSTSRVTFGLVLSLSFLVCKWDGKMICLLGLL